MSDSEAGSNGTRFYITTAIDYPNSRPHIGTAFEKIGADVQARFRRMEGDAVHFQMGNDENTIKVSQRAAELGVAPKPYVDDMARQFREVWDALDISYDDFIQTSEGRHRAGCQKFIQSVFDAKDIYKKSYTGLYCDGCEAFKTEKELVDGRCPNHPTQSLRAVEEENYFFALSKFRERLLAHYEVNPRFIQPESRRNEIVNLVEAGLQDVSISRKGFTWGIPVPFDGDQTIYVWFDALLNYVTAVGYGTEETRFESWWPADVHVIGKDITRFHCALWPAMLMSAGLPLPRQVFGHGFVYDKGVKVSKSGRAVDPMDLVRRHGADAFRYYFMKECPFGGDGNFSEERFAEVYNSDLAGNLGNLYSRVVTMCVKYFDGKLTGSSNFNPPEPLKPVVFPEHLSSNDCNSVEVKRADMEWWQYGEVTEASHWIDLIGTTLQNFEYTTALTMIQTGILGAANRYIEKKGPFKLAKTDPEKCKEVLVNLADALRVVAILLKPFLPKTAETFYRAFNFETTRPWQSVRYDDAKRSHTGPDLEVTAPLANGKPLPLFPRIDTSVAE